MDQITLTLQPGPHGLFRVADHDRTVYVPMRNGKPADSGLQPSEVPVWANDQIEIYVDPYRDHIQLKIKLTPVRQRAYVAEAKAA